MRRRNKTRSMSLVLRFTVGILMGLLVLGLSNAQNVEGSSSHKKSSNKAIPVSECGITLQDGYYELTVNLTCPADANPAITISGRAKLNLGGHTLSGVRDVEGNATIDCIRITQDGAQVWNGTVMSCIDGIRIDSSHNKIESVESSNNDRRGLRITGGSYNLLENCSASSNKRQGYLIEEGGSHNWVTRCTATENGRHGINIDDGSYNVIYFSTVSGNCRDGIEISGKKNSVLNNNVVDNANPETCDTDGDYSPWEYAGIDVRAGSEGNKIEHNSACGNFGCVGSKDSPCTARERNLWDENFDVSSCQCVSTNWWKHNTAWPECSPAP
jgi:parallel beta-helix repeat protein